MALRPETRLRDSVASLPALGPVRAALAGWAGPTVFVVGGTVRDLLLDREPADLDLAIEGELGQLLARLGGASDSHERFTTATVSVAGARYDLAQTRAETYPAPGALPQVRPATIADDLRRRDFRVNAMAVSLTGPRAGELVTVDRALADLDDRRLEVLHERSFEDDPTRLLRLVRYASRLGFEIGPQTAALAQAALKAGALATVSGARVGNELRLLATEADPVAAFAALSELGVDAAIDPAFSFAADQQALAGRALTKLPADGRPDLLVLAVALIGADRGHTEGLLDRLEFTAADRNAITEAASASRALADALASTRSGAQIAHAVGGAGVTTVALAAAQGDPAGPQRWLDELRHQSLRITGADLINAGIPAGPELGRRLAVARDAMWDGAAPDRLSQFKIALRAEAGQ